MLLKNKNNTVMEGLEYEMKCVRINDQNGCHGWMFGWQHKEIRQRP